MARFPRFRGVLRLGLCLLMAGILLSAAFAEARVLRIQIDRREPFEAGRTFAGVGAYERLLGRVYFALDPQAPANQTIVDLPLAQRNAQGEVEFWADLEILAPVDLSHCRGTLLYDVNNRGRRLALAHFNEGGDHFLMRHGLIVVWSGWLAEALPVEDRLRMEAPAIDPQSHPLSQMLRVEMVPEQSTTRHTVAQWAAQGCYPPTERTLAPVAAGQEPPAYAARLTWRMRESDPPVPIPREQWKLHVTPVEAAGSRGQMPLVELEIPSGLRAGYIYELLYEAHSPLVQGAGLAGIRDLVSFLRFDRSAQQPLRNAQGQPVVQRTLGFGVSQSGRALRQLLYDGFNADEQGRQVFDGLIPHVAGAGLGFFNHRFAMPTRTNGQHENHGYPADLFPFAYQDEMDPYSVPPGKTDGILRRSRAQQAVPKIMHTQTSAEYWHRSGSLVHTDPLGQRDGQLPAEVRLYALGGAQHSAGGGLPGPITLGQNPLNPQDYRPLMRALLLALESWVRDGTTPPESVYPKLADRSLVAWQESSSGWRALPGVRYPEVIQQPQAPQYGPNYWTSRQIDWAHYLTARATQPAPSYPVRVPACLPDNNERGVLCVPSLAVPVATYTGWNLRNAQAGAEGELYGLMGSYLPLAGTKSQREAVGDPRLSLAERYGSFDNYLAQYRQATEQLIKDRYLLAEELPRQLELAQRRREIFATAPERKP